MDGGRGSEDIASYVFKYIDEVKLYDVKHVIRRRREPTRILVGAKIEISTCKNVVVLCWSGKG